MGVTVRVLDSDEAAEVAPSLQRLIMQLSSSASGPDSATVAGRMGDERVRILGHRPSSRRHHYSHHLVLL
jgi:hypothetical protein